MNKKLFGILAYTITTLLIPTIFQFAFGEFSNIGFGNPIVNTLAFCAFFIVVPAIIIFISFLISFIKTQNSESVLRKIDEIGNIYTFSNQVTMFDVKDQDFVLLESIYNRENWLSRKHKDSKIIVYHSTQAKEYLNWIEFVFWDFLSRVGEEIRCKIIISLHYDENIRKSGMQKARDVPKYEKQFAYYSNVARKIIGKNVKVLNEEDFHKKHSYARFYAYNFHNKFVKCVINYISQALDGKLDYKGFMRKLSYIESVFPIMALSKSKFKNARLIVLDREFAHEVWQSSPFLEYKNNFGLLFITAQTLTYPNNEPIRIFSSEETVNITDDIPVIVNKLSNIDFQTKITMFELLGKTKAASIDIKANTILDESSVDQLLLEIFANIKSNYSF